MTDWEKTAMASINDGDKKNEMTWERIIKETIFLKFHRYFLFQPRNMTTQIASNFHEFCC